MEFRTLEKVGSVRRVAKAFIPPEGGVGGCGWL